ncbi:MAG: hydroxymethylglutaryl-CoA lyase [Candidatus Latescibacterota bacterium]|nr:MAG: hydroxymethylglutaryl-CoA lyase [Candidatus Latescibacterota bacterium]
MADTEELFARFRDGGAHCAGGKRPVFSGLVLNEKGLERAMAAGVEMLCMGVSASETHSRKNTGMGTDEALSQILSMAVKAAAAGKTVQASVQSAFGCGFEGTIPRQRVLGIVAKYIEAGVSNISLADTAGHAHPAQVEDLFGAVRALEANVSLACHFHNTYGLGLANCFAAMRSGVRILESAFGGLGGCPFTKVAAGNVCTEDLVHSLQRMGLCTDIDLSGLIDLAKDVGLYFERELPGFILKSGSLVRPKASA